MEKVLEGEIARFDVPDLLNLLHTGRRTGVLVMERPLQETKLFFSEGRPVFGCSTKEELRFGNMLLRLKKVSPPELERVMARRSSGGFRIGRLLLNDKILREEELASFLKVQVSEVIFDTFHWREGLFTFYDHVPPPATAVKLQMDLQNLVMEGVRRTDDRSRLKEIFPDLDMVVDALVNPERIKLNATLTQEEWQVFFLVDGRRTLSEICHLVGNSDELATLQVIHHLVAARFVTITLAPPEAAEAHMPSAPGAGKETTIKMKEQRDAAPGPVSVEFSSGVPARKLEDDTKEIVNPKAVQYLGNVEVKKLTVSRLILMKPDGETSFPLTRDSYTLGRHRNNDIRISDPKVSSFHARMDRSVDGFTIVDLNSRNGIFLNSSRIQKGLLKTGDEIRLGTARLVYRVDYTSSIT